MELTKEQLEAVRDGKPVRLSEEGTDMVVVCADAFERLRGLQYDDSPWTDSPLRMPMLWAGRGWKPTRARTNEPDSRRDTTPARPVFAATRLATLASK
jgi:hypothetical protein